MSETVQELGPESTGVWLVTTQGSSHTFDLDARTYTRHVGERSLSGPSAYDGAPQHIFSVVAWPKVGACFHIQLGRSWRNPPWRISSAIRSITRIEEDL